MLSEVLDLVNKGRAALNREPLTELPKGTPVDVCKCVIAEAFTDDHGVVSGRAIHFRDDANQDKIRALAKVWGTEIIEEGDAIVLPKLVKDFIHAFDIGEYPELLDFIPDPSDFRVRAGLDDYYWSGPHGLESHPFPTREEAQAHLNQFLERAPK